MIKMKIYEWDGKTNLHGYSLDEIIWAHNFLSERIESSVNSNTKRLMELIRTYEIVCGELFSRNMHQPRRRIDLTNVIKRYTNVKIHKC